MVAQWVLGARPQLGALLVAVVAVLAWFFAAYAKALFGAGGEAWVGGQAETGGDPDSDSELTISDYKLTLDEAKALLASYAQIRAEFPGSPLVVLHSKRQCPWCVKMKPVWAEAQQQLTGKRVIFVEVDQEQEPNPTVKTVPAVYMLVPGVSFRRYDDSARENVYDSSRLTAWILEGLGE